MIGYTDLDHLLKSAEPTIDNEEYIFVSVAACYGDHAEWTPIATFREAEGLTLVLLRSVADAKNIHYSKTFKRITMMVHSSLSAVGFTAALSATLAKNGISANVMAAYYHDHVFVPAEDAELAMSALMELANKK